MKEIKHMKNNRDLKARWIGQVKVLNQIYDVYLSELSASDEKEFGHVSFVNNKIVMTEHQSKQNLLETLIHEMLHIVYYELDLESGADEERIIRAFDNPVAKDFIQDKDNQSFFNRIIKGEFELDES